LHCIKHFNSTKNNIIQLKVERNLNNFFAIYDILIKNKEGIILRKFGELISKLRKQNGLTQEQLGKKLNVSYQAVSKWENNLSEPDFDTIEKMCHIFNINMTEFLELSDNIQTTRVDREIVHIKNNSKGTDFLKSKPWIIAIAMGVLIVFLSLLAFFIPVKHSAKQVYKKYDSSVFFISTNMSSTGTGFFINSSGLAVTNCPNISSCTSGKIRLYNGEIYNIEKLVGYDDESNLDLIQVDIKHSNPVRIGNANNVKLGDRVYAVTYTNDNSLDNAKSVLAEGMIFKTESSSDGTTEIQTTACVKNANCGSVIFDEYGYVVAISSGQLKLSGLSFEMVNICKPINIIKEIKKNINVSLEEWVNMHKVLKFYSDKALVGSKPFLLGETVAPIANPTKSGYLFDGWYTNESFTTKFNFEQPIIDQFSCYAKWTPITYIIRFDANGGNGTMDDVIATYDEELNLPDNKYQLKNYTFKGWKLQGQETLFSNNDSVKNLTTENNQVLILNAIWEIQKYTIIFNGNTADSGSMENIILEYDQKTNLPSNQFSKTGYLFDGWTYNGQKYQDGQEISMLYEGEGSIELLADWVPISYTIKFTHDGQSYEQKLVYDEPANLLPNTFTKEYFNFNCWYCAELKNIYYFQNEENIVNLTKIQGQVFEFVAQFTEYTYSIRYNPEQSIDLENCEIVNYRYSEERQTPRCFFSKTGYNFVHWIDDNGNIYENKAVNNNGVVTWVGTPICKLSNIDKDIINFYAIWEEITYNAYYKYVLKNETKYTSIGTKTYEEKFTLIDPEYVDDGYEFTHWQVYSKIYSKQETVSQLTRTNNSNVYIEAKYQPKQYNINFDGNGATQGEMLPLTVTFDENVTLPENSFSKEGYTFIGWDFNDCFYTTADIGIPISTYSDSITLTARWVENLKGEGTIINPYIVSTIKDLDNLADITIVNQFENCYVSLINDIDCEFAKLKEINFAGTFEGNGKKLINVDYANGSLFKENRGIIRNLVIENLKIDINNNTTDNIYIAGLVKTNRGFISRCYVRGNITIQSSEDVSIYGLVGSNIHNYQYGVIQRQIEFCFADLNVDILSETNINNCNIVGFAGGHSYAVDYNYSVLNLTANLKSVNDLYINAFGSKNNHSFSHANIDIKIDEVTNYNLKQTVPYYSDESVVKLVIGGKSVPNLAETTLALSQLKDKEWMENNLFDIGGVWVYSSGLLPVPCFTHQSNIDTQEQFMLLNDTILFGEYILNCDIDLSGNTTFRIRGNYGVFDGNGHKILNYSLQKNNYRKTYGLFEKNCGIIKNLGIDNLLIDLYFGDASVSAAGLVIENYGIINGCFVKGKINLKTSDGDSIAGGIVAVSYGGKVVNSYADVSVHTSTTSGAYSTIKANSYSGGIIAIGDGIVENCYSVKEVSTNAHYAQGTIFSAYGISGANGMVKNSFVLSNVSVSEYSSSGDYQVGGISKDYENSFAYEWQTIKRLNEDISFGDKSYEELCSSAFLEILNFKSFISKEDLEQNENNVWIISESDLPKLWFEQ